MIKAVIFDLDDTLISEYEYVKSGFLTLSKYINEQYHIQGAYNKLLGLYQIGKTKVINRLFEECKFPISDNEIMDMVNLYRNHIPNIRFNDEVENSIRSLKDKGIKLGIITDGYYVTQKKKLDVLNAYNIFDKIILTDELGRDYWKPNPRSFEMIKDFFNLQYDEIMYVGDNPMKDFYIGSIYPIQTIRIYNSVGVYCNSDYFKNIKEKTTIYRFEEILSFI